MVTQTQTTVSEKHTNTIAFIVLLLILGNMLFSFVKTDLSSTSNSMTLIVLSGAALAFLVAMVHFQLALVIFIFIAPLVIYYLPGIPFYLTIGDAFLLVLTVIFFVRVMAGRERQFSKTLHDRAIFLFLSFSICSLLKSRDFADGVKEIVQSFEYFICCYYLFSFAVSDRKLMDSLLHTILVVSGMVALRGIYEYGGMGGSDYRISSTFSHFNANGTFLAMTTTLAFTMVALPGLDRKTKIIRFTILAFNAFALLLSFSRGAWIGAVIGIVISTQLKGMVNFFKIFLVSLVVVVLISLFVPTNRYTERFKSISDTSESSSINRLAQYKIAYWAIVENPLLGIGVSNNKYYAAEKHNQPWNAEIHNLYLHIGAERGIPAMLILIWIFLTYYTNLYKRATATKDPYFKSLYTSFMAVMVAYGVANLFAYMLVRGPAMFFAIFLGLFQSAIYIEDHEHKEVEWAQMLSTIDLKRSAVRMGL